MRAVFLAGATAKGVPIAVATAVFEQLRAFGSYSFPKSHAAAFAVIVYQSAWLKRYHGAAFFCALLNNQPMGFWPPAVLIGDARRHGLASCRPTLSAVRRAAHWRLAESGWDSAPSTDWARCR